MVRGGEGTLDDLESSLRKKIHRIASESTSNVLSAAASPLSAFIPNLEHRIVVRVLTRIGRVRRLDSLLDWGQRVLDLALNKLRHMFGSNF